MMATDPAKQLERNARLMELLARTALSDERAFAELYRLTSSHLYGVALRILRESAAAEEALQESYVNVWHHAGSYVAAKSHPLTWLTSVVRNRCLDQLRRREAGTVTLDDEEESVTIADDAPSPLEMLIAGADARAIKACVDALEAAQKQAIPLAEAAPAIVPPARVWAAILARIRGSTVATAERRSFWGSLSLWRRLALAGFATAFALALVLLRPAAERPAEIIVVVLAGQDAK